MATLLRSLTLNSLVLLKSCRPIGKRNLYLRLSGRQSCFGIW